MVYLLLPSPSADLSPRLLTPEVRGLVARRPAASIR